MSQLKYMPVFRSRQQEFAVLSSFDFGMNMYPCLEIFKERDRLVRKPKTNNGKPKKPEKTFEEFYFPLINSIKAERVFIDLPVHFREYPGMNPECLEFMRRVVAVRTVRTDYMKKFSVYSPRVIPVISSYYGRKNEPDSILMQVNDLRPLFPNLAFRVLLDSFDRDLDQIERIIQPSDYLIVDFGEQDLNELYVGQQEIIARLNGIRATVIIHKSPILKETKNTDLIHKAVISSFRNDHIQKLDMFAGSCFSDYAGIKKDDIPKGGGISPGFIYYDAVEDKYYGYKGIVKKLATFETIIVPDILSSLATQRMTNSVPTFLHGGNAGWQTLNLIQARQTPGKNAGKFKRIGMEHYLSCMKMKIV